MSKDSAEGVLIPIGGNEDKGSNQDDLHSLDFIDEGILYQVVSQAGGVHAKIVVLPAASSIPEEVGQNYQKAFAKLGCTNVHVLQILKRADAETKNAVEMISTANALMFSGGDQSKITRKIGGTEIHKIMASRYQNERFVIAGTSAGAMCMSQEMIRGGNHIDSFRKGTVILGKGMEFIPSLIIDSHFIRRGRFGRLTEAVACFPNLIGVGLGEDTGLIIRNDQEFEVIGSGMVIVFDARNVTHNNQSILQEGTPMTITNMTTHVLSNGDKFEIESRKIKVMPMDPALAK
ncbi:MAG: cyanophycinase [Flammeovirgaceae bacterium]|jgi:cyanophycinase